jgi:hypothetical protein
VRVGQALALTAALGARGGPPPEPEVDQRAANLLFRWTPPLP